MTRPRPSETMRETARRTRPDIEQETRDFAADTLLAVILLFAGIGAISVLRLFATTVWP